VTRLRRGLGTAAFVLERNRRRLAVLGIDLAAVVAIYGAGQIVETLTGLVGSGPALIIQLVFVAFVGIAQFLGLMWFLSRPRKYVVTPDDPQIDLSFDQYRGQPDLLAHARSLVTVLRGAHRLREMGGELPRGMLLSGAPGTGKTFLAGCVAAEARIPFIYVDASSLTSMWFGVDALIVVSLFRQARQLGRRFAEPGTPGACILFIDELDSIGVARSGMAGGGGQVQGGIGGGMLGGMRGFALNTMLNQMDSLGAHVEDRWTRRLLRWLGFIRGPVPAKPVVFVIGATNRPEVLDPALTRPGRLDRLLTVHKPDADGRRDIIGHYLSKKAHEAEIPVELMVSDSIGWSPVDIKTIVNEALIVAHEDGRDSLTYRDWLTATDARFLGLRQPIRGMHADDRRAIAYHEAGHAVVAHYLKPENRTLKASIVRVGPALGVVQQAPLEERYTLDADQIEADIMVALGSRAVEELILGRKMTGAGGDLAAATARAVAYVGSFGMGTTLVSFGSSGVPASVIRVVDRLLADRYDEVKRLIAAKEPAVHAVAAALVERDELIGSELDDVFAAAEAQHPSLRAPFGRRPAELPSLYDGVVLAAESAPLATEAAAVATAWRVAGSWPAVGPASWSCTR
jgi:cell division protease FtsH